MPQRNQRRVNPDDGRSNKEWRRKEAVVERIGTIFTERVDQGHVPADLGGERHKRHVDDECASWAASRQTPRLGLGESHYKDMDPLGGRAGRQHAKRHQRASPRRGTHNHWQTCRNCAAK